jgi:hypothetical protein
MTEKSDAPQVRVVFEGELRKRFEAVKRYYGIAQNADLIRMLVTLKYEDLKKEGRI